MKWEALRSFAARRPFFREADLHAGRGAAPAELVQLSLWVREGRLLRLRKGYYALAGNDPSARTPLLALAEPLYRPSYVSLEWALNHYGLIPDSPGSVTCVTTLKTARFDTPLGTVAYRHVSPRFFFGFSKTEKPAPCWIASREKALLDFFHLSIPKSIAPDPKQLLANYRLQNLGTVRKARLKEMMRKFGDPRVEEWGKSCLLAMKMEA